MAGLASIT